jgi:hypothetical protein
LTAFFPFCAARKKRPPNAPRHHQETEKQKQKKSTATVKKKRDLQQNKIQIIIRHGFYSIKYFLNFERQI